MGPRAALRAQSWVLVEVGSGGSNPVFGVGAYSIGPAELALAQMRKALSVNQICMRCYFSAEQCHLNITRPNKVYVVPALPEGCQATNEHNPTNYEKYLLRGLTLSEEADFLLALKP